MSVFGDEIEKAENMIHALEAENAAIKAEVEMMKHSSPWAELATLRAECERLNNFIVKRNVEYLALQEQNASLKALLQERMEKCECARDWIPGQNRPKNVCDLCRKSQAALEGKLAII